MCSLRQTGWWTLILHLPHIDRRSMSRHKTRPGTFQFTAVLVKQHIPLQQHYGVIPQPTVWRGVMGVFIHCASDNEAFDCTVCIARWWADTLNYRLHKLYWPHARACVCMYTHTQTHTHFLMNWRQKQRQGQWGVRLKIQPWLAQHWWVKATVVMSRGGCGLIISKSAIIKMMWWDRARISWKHTADSGLLFDRSSIVIKSKDKKMFLGGTLVTKGQWLRKWGRDINCFF